MTAFEFDPSLSLSTNPVVATLTTAIGAGPVPQPRTVVGADEPTAEEGLALMRAYLAIEEPAVRQAILDAVSTIAAKL